MVEAKRKLSHEENSRARKIPRLSKDIGELYFYIKKIFRLCKARLHLQLLLRFLLRFSTFDGYERVNQSRMFMRESIQSVNIRYQSTLSHLSKEENRSSNRSKYRKCERACKSTCLVKCPLHQLQIIMMEIGWMKSSEANFPSLELFEHFDIEMNFSLYRLGTVEILWAYNIACMIICFKSIKKL